MSKPENLIKLIPEDVWITFCNSYLKDIINNYDDSGRVSNEVNMARVVAELWYAHGEQLIQEYEARQSAGVTLEEFYE